MLNPVNHSCTRAGAHAYKVEPYVIAADIYAESPHVRRGGWTWYTGAAGWLYRAQTEWLLGIRIQAGNLKIDPCIPRHWRNYKVNYRHGSATYEIHVANPNGVMRGVASLTLDRQVLPQGQSAITLVDDGKRHRVEVVLG
ncbi:GH36-type glycosyl hydrolase domain-containing protein [Undibacterium arcticum]